MREDHETSTVDAAAAWERARADDWPDECDAECPDCERPYGGPVRYRCRCGS